MSRLLISVVSIVLVWVVGLLFTLPTPGLASGSAHLAQDASSNATDSQNVLIKNVTIADLQGQFLTASIRLRDGYIESIGNDLSDSGDEHIVDGTGLTALPGLIDSHTHSFMTALEDALRFGVTTSIDMFSPASVLLESRVQRERVEHVAKADLYSAGVLATVAGGHGTQYGISVDTLSRPADAEQWLAARHQEGSDFIKLVYMPYQSGLPSLDRATAKAVIDAAHARDLMAVAHISTQRAARDMLEDGIDGLVHIFADEQISDDVLALAVTNEVFVIPTLAVLASIAGESFDQANDTYIKPHLSAMQRQTLQSSFPGALEGFDLDIALTNVRALHEAGVTILAGSDSPNPGTAHGVSLHHELALLVRAGMPADMVVQAATYKPAAVFDLIDRGFISQGLRADLVLVRGAPYQNISDTLQIEHVIKNGYLIHRDIAEKSATTKLASGVIATFEESFENSDGLEWQVSTDKMAGGQSVAYMDRVARQDRPSEFALAIKTEVKSGFGYPWSGVGVGVAGPKGALDISEFETISFDIRGTAGTYRLMMIGDINAGIPPSQTFRVTEQWQTITFPLSAFAGFDPKRFAALSIVAGPVPGKFDFRIDEVRFEP